MRKVIITERQYRFLLENNDAVYNLDSVYPAENSDTYDASSPEVGLSEPNMTGPTTDKKAKTKSKYSRFGCNTTLEEDIKKKSGGNKDIKNRTIELPNFITNTLDNSRQSNEIRKNGTINTDRAKKIVSRHGEDSQVGKYLKSQMKAMTNNVKSMKQQKLDNGEENAFIKTHTKVSGNGKAHSKKDNISVTYFD